MNNEQVLELLSQNDEDLFLAVGRDITGVGVRQYSRNEIIQIAQNWLTERREYFSKVICPDRRVQALLNLSDSQERQLQLVIAIVDLISGLLIGISPWTVAVLLTHCGIESLCIKPDKDDSKY